MPRSCLGYFSRIHTSTPFPPGSLPVFWRMTAMAAYIEELSEVRKTPTVKQYLACKRMLFDRC